MSADPRRYTPDHHWVEPGDGRVRVGVTARLTAALRAAPRAVLPAPGTRLRAAEPYGVLETDKAAVDLYAPCDGEVVAINPALGEDAALVMSDPLGAGWLLELVPDGPIELWDADRYARWQ